MILFCDFNPKIKRVYKVLDFKKNSENEYSENRIFASGTAIDMLVFLKNLGDNPSLITFLGGERGNLIKENLQEGGVNFKAVEIKDESLEEVIIKSRSLKTVIRSRTPRLTIEEEENFYDMFTRELTSDKIVCISQKQGISDWKQYEYFINLCYKKGIKVLVATDKITNLGNSKPYILITSKEELEDHTNLKIGTEVQAVRASNIILSKGIGIVIVSSEKGIVITTNENSYTISYDNFKESINKFNNELILAGIAFGIERKYDFKMTIEIAAAAGVIENFLKFREVNMADIKKIMGDLELKSIKEII